ncbi:MAG: DNA polymerase III subunit alpha [Bacteroidetes bacterium]|nr:DNA polymerase III subunit alpha [Bacteroidota bacterium]
MYLNCHSFFSFKYGTLGPENIFSEAKRLGIRKIALTDINSTAGVVEMLRICATHRQDPEDPYDLQIAAGVEFRNDDRLQYIAVAKNEDGFEEINRFLSKYDSIKKPFPDRAPYFKQVVIIYPIGRHQPGSLKDNEYIGIKSKEVSKWKFQIETLKGTDPDYALDRFVAWQPVTFISPEDLRIHRLLRAIEHNTLITKLNPGSCASKDEIFYHEPELKHLFEPAPELINRAETLIRQCSLDLELGKNKNKATILENPEQDWQFLVQQATEGFNRKYPDAEKEIRERFSRELSIIREKDFVAYYLITYDMVRYAKSMNFDFIGRGSGANSMVAFCLNITNVDPVELDLYFERFLNPERSSPPDFDLDFAWDQRDHIYQYLLNRYGQDHVCLLGTHTTLQERSVIRELGKVFGLPKEEIDQLADDPETFGHRDSIAEEICRHASRLKDFPVNISIHAGGVLISEKPIYRYSALTVPPKGFPVSHLEMHNAEDVGLYKFDVLSQRGLGHLRETVRLVEENQGVKVNINRFNDFKEDEAVRDLLRRGKTIGCFYVESPAMRMLLKKLSCEDYRTLVAASSIIRPGVARSGMMRAYIERFHLSQEGKPWPSVHPLMNEILSETYGVMVYQEDVIRVAHLFAGLSLAEADILRRGMSGKFRSRREFERIRERFFNNCKIRGYEQEITDRIWYEIESFSGYSFAKGHSASYAVESYQSLFLKAHYPLEFMVGVINNFGGFYRTEFYFHEARMAGAEIEAPCINQGKYLTSISNKTIFTGFIHLTSLENQLAQSIERERDLNGLYRNLGDFLNRIPASLEQIRILIRAGAFRYTGKTKQQLLWEAFAATSDRKAKRAVGTAELFIDSREEISLPALERNELEDVFDEIELLGFPLKDPFALLAGERRSNHLADDLKTMIGRRVTLIGYLVTTKNTYTATRKSMYFGTFIDADGNFFDTVHFPESAARNPFRGRGFYQVAGKVSEEFGVLTIEVSTMKKLPIKNIRENPFHRTEKFPKP